MKPNTKLIFSIFCLCYFSVLIYSSYNTIHFNQILEAILELLTLPLMFLMAWVYYISIRDWHFEKFAATSIHFFIIVVLSISIALITVSSVYNF